MHLAKSTLGTTRRLTLKTHILIATITILLTSACASNRGRSISSTEESLKEQQEYSRQEGSAGREVIRQ
jgi:hypothetical protein